MNHSQVWMNIKRSEMSPDSRGVKTKWVFKIKRNGVLCARLVGCGYSQISGVDYTENYSPVITAVTWCVLLIIMLLKKYYVKLIDIQVVFLHGDLEEEIYLDCPQGLEDAKEDKFVKLRSISISTSVLEETSEWFEIRGIQGWLT